MSKIVIKIKAGATVNDSTVTATGQLVNIIANSERASFGIANDAALKRAVGKYMGKEPTDVFLRSPTPWDDLYKTYGWSQVERVVKPKKAEILVVTSKPFVTSKTTRNFYSTPINLSDEFSVELTNTVSTQWSNSSKVSIQQMIKYEIGFEGTGVGGARTFGFEHTWGTTQTKTDEAKVGTKTGINMNVMPGDSVTSEIIATSGKMSARITYEASLRGDTAVNYYPKYKDHHFYGLSIDAVLGGKNKVLITEDIELGYYTNISATVKPVL